MSIDEYICQNKQIYADLLDYIESDYEDLYQTIIDRIENHKITKNRGYFKEMLHLIIKISDNHFRNTNFINKIKKILIYFKDEIMKTFSNCEIFDLFKTNKLIFLFLIENKVITIDNLIINRFMISKSKYFIYFYFPEIKPKIDFIKIQKIESEMLNIDPDIFENFETKRQIGENDSYLCNLIRNDLIEKFIVYINQRNISISSQIKPSIFETNYFLDKNQPTIIEYAAFFGSIQIFQYLILNGVELKPSLFLYAIHSKNPELIHILEEYHLITDIIFYKKCLKESIKCHHNDFGIYFQDNFIENQNHDDFNSNEIKYGFKFYNYYFIPNNLHLNLNYTFYYSCQYDYYTIVNYMIQNKYIFQKPHKFLYYAAKGNNNDILNLLQSKYIIPNSFRFFKGLKKLTQINFLSKNKNISYEAFDGCISLYHITIPSSITSIGKKAFRSCISLHNITIPPLVKSIGRSAFKNCESLEQIIIPSNVMKIAKSIFSCCISLKKVTLPPSLSEIGSNAFFNCKSLSEIKIPQTVAIINISAFEGCSSLTNIEFELHSNLRRIKDHAFMGCSSLSQIVIPENAFSFGYSIFENCISLREISFLSKSLEFVPASGYFRTFISVTNDGLVEFKKYEGSYIIRKEKFEEKHIKNIRNIISIDENVKMNLNLN